MADVVIYTKPGCPYCSAAKSLLVKKGADFTEIVADRDAGKKTVSEIVASNDPEKKQEMIQKSGGRMTFPQVFIDGKHIGGSDDLHALDARGGLDTLLAA